MEAKRSKEAIKNQRHRDVGSALQAIRYIYAAIGEASELNGSHPIIETLKTAQKLLLIGAMEATASDREVANVWAASIVAVTADHMDE